MSLLPTIRPCLASLIFFAPAVAPPVDAEPAPDRPPWQERLERAAQTPEAWRERAEWIRARILVAAGLWPPFDRPPLKPVVFHRLERDGYTVEKVHFETWPGFHLTGNLYRPLGKTGPFPAVVSPHGHWKEGRFADEPTGSVPGRAITLARMGFVVFSYDMVGFGDLKQIPHDFGDPLWGISLCGLQLWNSIRAVDFLVSLPDVDPKRIGCTGASGGGTQTFLLTAVDDRIACAAPVNMVAADFQGGCLCENPPLLRIDLNNVEIAAATAPRPLLLVSATGDWTKDNPKLEAPAIQKAYDRLGIPERFRCVQFDAPHNYNKDSREAVYAWFVHWLRAGEIPTPNSQLPTKSQSPNPNAGPDPAVLGSKPQTRNSGPPMRIPEPPFQVEKREDLAVWGPDRPLPEGAANAAKLAETMRAAIRAQLEALRPRDAAGLARFREVMEDALAGTLTVRSSLPQHICIDNSRDLEEKLQSCKCVTLVAYLNDSPDAEAANEIRRSLPGGKGNWNAGYAMTASPAYVDPSGCPPERELKRFPATFCRTGVAHDVHSMLSLIETNRRPALDSLRTVGVGNSGIPIFLASALAPKNLQLEWTIVDLQGRSPLSEESWTGPLAHPGILRVGGLRTAGCLIAAKGGKLVLHNTQGKFDATWIRDAFKAAGREGDLVVDEKAWTVEQIVEALK